MKNFKNVILGLLMLALLPAFNSCSSDDDIVWPTSQVKNLSELPGWLEKVVRQVGESYAPAPATGEYLYPTVVKFTYKGETYIELFDTYSSGVDSIRFFTEKGKEILPPTNWPSEETQNSQYTELMASKKENSVVLFSIL